MASDFFLRPQDAVSKKRLTKHHEGPKIGKCSKCRARRVIVESGPRGKFCQSCYDAKLKKWNRAFAGYDLKIVPAKLEDHGDDVPF